MLLCPPAFPQSKKGRDSDAETIIKGHYQILKSLYEDKAFSLQAIDEQISRILDERFNYDRLAADILEKEWKKLNRSRKEKFIRALKSSLKMKVFSVIERYQDEGLPAMSLKSQKTKGNASTLAYTLTGDRGQTEFEIEMQKQPEAKWTIKNVKRGRKNLIKYYNGYCEKLLKDYSFPYLIAELSDAGFIVLEDFESSRLGGLPEDWIWKGKDDKKFKPYTIKKEQGNKFLAAEDKGESVILGKRITWDLSKYPYLSFRWRGRVLPEGGDERFGNKNDSCAAIYITYKRKLRLVPVSVKYVWSTTLPVGAATRRSGTGRPWNVVAESGEEHLGTWRTYTFNAYEAYRKTFGGNPPDKPVAIGLLTDANATKSRATADYDDIRALRSADADSGINNILAAE